MEAADRLAPLDAGVDEAEGVDGYRGGARSAVPVLLGGRVARRRPRGQVRVGLAAYGHRGGARLPGPPRL